MRKSPENLEWKRGLLPVNPITVGFEYNDDLILLHMMSLINNSRLVYTTT